MFSVVVVEAVEVGAITTDCFAEGAGELDFVAAEEETEEV